MSPPGDNIGWVLTWSTAFTFSEKGVSDSQKTEMLRGWLTEEQTAELLAMQVRNTGVSTRRDSLTYERNKLTKKIVTFMWCSNVMFRYVFKAEFVMRS